MAELPNIIDLPGLIDFIDSKKIYIQNEYNKLLTFTINFITNNLTLENHYKEYVIYYDVDLSEIDDNEKVNILKILCCKLQNDLLVKGYNSMINPFILNNNDMTTYGIDCFICAEVYSLFF